LPAAHPVGERLMVAGELGDWQVNFCIKAQLQLHRSVERKGGVENESNK